MGLVYVQGDSVTDRIKRRGRFSLPRDCAASPPHFLAAVKSYQEKMIEGFVKKDGYRWIGPDFELRGPLVHIEFSEDATVDPGPMGAPNPLDLEASAAWERAEQARRAKVVGERVGDLVDFQLVTVFERKLPGAKRALPHSFLPQRQPRR